MEREESSMYSKILDWTLKKIELALTRMEKTRRSQFGMRSNQHILRLLIFLPAILIPACASSSPAFLMMYSTYKLNKQGDNIQPWRTPFPIWNQSVVTCPVLTVATCRVHHGIRSYHFMANIWGNNGNSDRLYFLVLQKHCRWWLQPWK